MLLVIVDFSAATFLSTAWSPPCWSVKALVLKGVQSLRPYLHEAGRCGQSMAGKVSKAKRPKRRWIGIALPHNVQSREDLTSVLESSPFESFRIKLYDCHPSGSEAALAACSIQKRVDEVGFAIICVLLSQYIEVRNILDSGDGHGLMSITSSGKIRLVRERLGIPKPSRR